MSLWKKWRYLSLAMMIALLSSNPSLFADDLVVTATRSARKNHLLPQMVDVISAKDLQEDQVRTVPEMLKGLPSVMVQKTGHGQGSPFIRGFTSFRTLLLIDGIRLNNSVFRAGPNQYWNTVDPFSIQSVEVVKGPSAVLYGSDAVGGTVNLRTRGPAMADKSGLKRRGVVQFRSAEHTWIERAELRGQSNLDKGTRWGFHLGGTAKNFGDVDGGKHVGRQEKTGYDERDIDSKVVYVVNDDSQLIWGYNTVDIDDAWRTHKTIFGAKFEDTTNGSELERVLFQERRLNYLRYRGSELNSWLSSLEATLSYHEQVESQHRIKSSGQSDDQGFDVDTLGLGLQMSSELDHGLLTYGLEHYRDRVDSFKKSFNADGTLNAVAIQGPVGDDATYDLLGIYAQDEFDINDRVSAIIGVRYTMAKVKVGRFKDPVTGLATSLSDRWSRLTGSARLLYQMDSHLNVFTGISQAFRAPNLSDLTRLDEARSNEIETASPDLDPENYIAWEIGIKAQYDKWDAQVAYYYTDISDMITRTPTGNVIAGDAEVQKVNSGDGFVQGIEVLVSRQIHKALRWGMMLSWQDGEVDTFATSSTNKTREVISRMMPLSAMTHMRWQRLNKPYWVEMQCLTAQRQDELSTRDAGDGQRIPSAGTPGYGVVNLRSAWHGQHVGADIKLGLAVENIFDKDYRIHGSGLNEAGRNILVTTDVTF